MENGSNETELDPGSIDGPLQNSGPNRQAFTHGSQGNSGPRKCEYCGLIVNGRPTLHERLGLVHDNCADEFDVLKRGLML